MSDKGFFTAFAGIFLLWLACVATIIFVVVHFITKFW